VKLLLDENLSPRQVNRLNLLFPGLTPVREVGLKQADDQQIWDWARDNEFAIITTDADFVALA
jgi:predicted nuclease of predicted toxin-antitoxin system